MASRSLHYIIAIIAGISISCSVSDERVQTSLIENKSVVPDQKALSGLQIATFASGCFWCMEGVYESVKGVKEVVSGYSGGKEKNPTYDEVGSGRTGHAESIQVYYDSSIVNFNTLVKVYFGSQDPTQVNGQGPDHGKQYRSIIFFNNDYEKKIAQDQIVQLNKSGAFESPVAAEVVPLEKFWEAEGYHQDYVRQHPDESYVLQESIPRIKRFQARFPELIIADKKL